MITLASIRINNNNNNSKSVRAKFIPAVVGALVTIYDRHFLYVAKVGASMLFHREKS